MATWRAFEVPWGHFLFYYTVSVVKRHYYAHSVFPRRLLSSLVWGPEAHGPWVREEPPALLHEIDSLLRDQLDQTEATGSGVTLPEWCHGPGDRGEMTSPLQDPHALG